ncbi:uncharacterized protein LODBEIA_P41810 [Lodderomyces beijingensis]|uniref:Uncharacterized protein n=1 Tax=Lodderomyces beijingensis TaxID=1775926 RepID=A0ABP0ZPA4_9ASCO
MLTYILEEVDFEEFILLAAAIAPGRGYIVVADADLYHAQLKLPELSPRLVHGCDALQMVLIESWSEMYELLETIQEVKVVALYGILSRFVEEGLQESMDFMVEDQFSAHELNQYFHKLFTFHARNNVQVLMADHPSLALEDTRRNSYNNSTEALLDLVVIPNVYSSKGGQIHTTLRASMQKWFAILESTSGLGKT